MLEKLKEEVLLANLELKKQNLVIYLGQCQCH